MYGSQKYSREELKNFILLFIEKEGRVPKQRDFLGNKDYPSFKQYRDEFGSWSNALIEIGCRDTQYPVNKNTHVCATCGKVFEAYGKRKYCSDECRYIGSRKGYTTTSSSNVQAYRKIAFSQYPWKCCICGYKEFTDKYVKGTKYFKYPVILDVHHLNEDREDNDLDNLVILCPTCHALIHRGVYINVRRSPLFREKLLFDIADPFVDESVESPFEEHKSVF